MGKKIALGAVALLVAAFLGVWLIYLPSQIVYAARVPLDSNPAKFGMAYEKVAFPAHGGGLTIRAWWMPAKSARAVLIFVHGGNINRRERYAGGLELAQFFTGRGVTVLAPDMRNHGESGTARGGKITLGIDESLDVRGAIDYAAKRAPGLPIYVMGDSMGGAAAIFAAADDARIRRLVLLDPLLDAKSTEEGALYATLGLPRLFVGPIRWSADTFFAPDIARRDALATAEALPIPILLIGDDHDPICRPAFAHALAAANRHVTFWVSPDPAWSVAASRWGPHTAAFRLHPREVEALLTNFLAPEH